MERDVFGSENTWKTKKNAYSEILMHQSRFSFYSEVAFFRVIFFLKDQISIIECFFDALVTALAHLPQSSLSRAVCCEYMSIGTVISKERSWKYQQDKSAKHKWQFSCVLTKLHVVHQRCIVDADSSDSREAREPSMRSIKSRSALNVVLLLRGEVLQPFYPLWLWIQNISMNYYEIQIS